MGKDRSAWGFKSVDAIRFGKETIKVFYQDPKDSSINWFDFNVPKDKFTAYGQLLPAGKAGPKTPLVAVTFVSEDGTQRIRVFYCDSNLYLKETYFDNGQNPKDGPLNDKKIQVAPRSPLAATTFKRDDVPNIRIYFAGTGKRLREWSWGAYGKREWAQGPVVRESINLSMFTRICCINLRPWSNPSPALRLFGFDFYKQLYEHTWNEGWGENVNLPVVDFSPINNSIDCVATRVDTDNPRSFIYFVLPWTNTIMERFRIGDVFEAGKQTIVLDRVHPFSVVSYPLTDQPDHMHMFMTNGRDFIHYARDKGVWSEKALPQTQPENDLTDVQSIKNSLGSAK